MRTQLLATFTNKTDLDKTIRKIENAYTIAFSKIYVLQNESNINELICTYNVDLEAGADYNDVKGTISLHRKKHSNTLYTINALNEVIANLNNGLIDSKFIVPWENARKIGNSDEYRLKGKGQQGMIKYLINKGLISDVVLNDKKLGKVFNNALKEVFDYDSNSYVLIN